MQLLARSKQLLGGLFKPKRSFGVVSNSHPEKDSHSKVLSV